MPVLRRSCFGGGVRLDVCYEDGHIVSVEGAVECVGGCVNVKFPSGQVGLEHDAFCLFIHNGHVAGQDL